VLVFVVRNPIDEYVASVTRQVVGAVPLFSNGTMSADDEQKVRAALGVYATAHTALTRGTPSWVGESGSCESDEWVWHNAHVRGVRVALSTGCNLGERNRRAWRNVRVSSPPTRVRIRPIRIFSHRTRRGDRAGDRAARRDDEGRG
jgi:hypothetical protein